MSDILNPTSIPALAALGGSLIGVLGSGLSAWIVQRHQDRRDLLTKKIFHREQLYSDFISETARAMADALQHGFHDSGSLIPSYALLSRIRLSSSTIVVKNAELIINQILHTYSQPNLTPEEFHAWANERNDPLRDFGDICRRELDSLWSGL